MVFWQSINRKGIHLNVSVLSFFFKRRNTLFCKAGKTAFIFSLSFPPRTHLAYRMLPHTPATTIINYFRIRRSENWGHVSAEGTEEEILYFDCSVLMEILGHRPNWRWWFLCIFSSCSCSILSNSYQYFQAKHSGFDLLLLLHWMQLSVLLLMLNIPKLFGVLAFFSSGCVSRRFSSSAFGSSNWDQNPLGLNRECMWLHIESTLLN